MPSSVKKSSNFNELAGKPYAKRNHYDESRYSQDFGVIVISFESNCGHGVDTLMNLQRCDVVLLNDDQTPMEFVVFVLERFFGMTRPEAQSQMLSIHYEGRAICGTYPYEEAEKKVADVLAFAGEHKHPLQCVLERAD